MARARAAGGAGAVLAAYWAAASGTTSAGRLRMAPSRARNARREGASSVASTVAMARFMLEARSRASCLLALEASALRWARTTSEAERLQETMCLQTRWRQVAGGKTSTRSWGVGTNVSETLAKAATAGRAAQAPGCTRATRSARWQTLAEPRWRLRVRASVLFR